MLIMGTSFAAIDLKLDKVSLGKVTKFFRLLPTHFLVFQFYTILNALMNIEIVCYQEMEPKSLSFLYLFTFFVTFC